MFLDNFSWIVTEHYWNIENFFETFWNHFIRIDFEEITEKLLRNLEKISDNHKRDLEKLKDNFELIP